MQYTLREVVQNRLLWIVLFFALIGIGGAAFVGDLAIIENRAVETSLLAAAYRFCAVFVMVIVVISTIVREFNDKCLVLYLSLPISRAIYFVGKLAGFYIAGIIVAFIFSLIMAYYADFPRALLWFSSLACEIILMTTFGLFCVITFNQQVLASLSAAFLFYLLCRVSDTIYLISQGEILLRTTGSTFIQWVVKVLVVVLPNLERFTRTEWLAYGDFSAGDVMFPIVAQTVIYTVLAAAAALIDFRRKNL